ncbi:MAG: hypothetical protein COU63_04670 [Candidatus Pacebacteria bacterium CG10_big_fil_rev_8_21_14_0_10_36_11]|nr:hypothetical protein [Candidatus Pacearchaeota archaeon]OIP73998.1 MAG: hypothetical protein AUK08_01945 [Candidatus Pacebacteria bacterium CG2_30_36_39]PIR64363.1 MAG: hypothetical protein COU63_04670 [Candidatus Pacebacteria bacterium CG10_big_fil_rev_8_21_14_0_10_36_11]PJC43128.1 MAG: hypothetical protein CO040_00820 [Candidatus Pacebacteria bacterium CG_4_9_14_0_2_um_filter_36_8]
MVSIENGNQSGIGVFTETKKFIASLGGSVIFEKSQENLTKQSNFLVFKVLEFFKALNFRSSKEKETPNFLRLDHAFVGGLIELFRSLNEQDFISAVVVGGGTLARLRIEDAQSFGEGNGDNKQLDYVGIAVSETNAVELLAILLRQNIAAKRLLQEKEELIPGNVYLRGGIEPGHTTDFVAVTKAVESGASVVVNISNTPGLYPLAEDGSLDSSKIIGEMSLADYLEKFAVEHRPGVNTPFDAKAAELAMENNITVILVGNDVENLKKLVVGEDFVGTILN